MFVLFHSGLKHIPAGALVIEIGPHQLLRTFVNKTVPDSNYIGLMKKQSDDNQIFIDALGMCYTYGLDINWNNFYNSLILVGYIKKISELSILN